MTLKDDLARMEAEDKAATPGPWVVGPGQTHDYMSGPKDKLGITAADWRQNSDLSLLVAEAIYNGNTGYERKANAALISASRTDRPALVEMVRLIMKWNDDATHEMTDATLERLWTEAKKKAGG